LGIAHKSTQREAEQERVRDRYEKHRPGKLCRDQRATRGRQREEVLPSTTLMLQRSQQRGLDRGEDREHENGPEGQKPLNDQGRRGQSGLARDGEWVLKEIDDEHPHDGRGKQDGERKRHRAADLERFDAQTP